MKVEKKTRILLYSWLPTGPYHKNLAILGHYSVRNPVYWSKSYFQVWNLTRLPEKTHIAYALSQLVCSDHKFLPYNSFPFLHVITHTLQLYMSSIDQMHSYVEVWGKLWIIRSWHLSQKNLRTRLSFKICRKVSLLGKSCLTLVTLLAYFQPNCNSPMGSARPCS